MIENGKKEGWLQLPQCRKLHYFVEGDSTISLCSKWDRDKWEWTECGCYEEVDDDSPGNCVICQRKLANRLKAINQKIAEGGREIVMGLWRCNWRDCDFGMRLAGMDSCPGDPRDPNCPYFQAEGDIMNETELLEYEFGDKEAEFQAYEKKPVQVWAKEMLFNFTVKTLRGIVKGQGGDYLIKGVNGELYPCARDIFYKTYKPVE